MESFSVVREWERNSRSQKKSRLSCSRDEEGKRLRVVMGLDGQWEADLFAVLMGYDGLVVLHALLKAREIKSHLFCLYYMDCHHPLQCSGCTTC